MTDPHSKPVRGVLYCVHCGRLLPGDYRLEDEALTRLTHPCQPALFVWYPTARYGVEMPYTERTPFNHYKFQLGAGAGDCGEWPQIIVPPDKRKKKSRYAED